MKGLEWISPIIAGVFSFVFGLVVATIAADGTQDSCRAANPGYECHLGWVKAEPFK